MTIAADDDAPADTAAAAESASAPQDAPAEDPENNGGGGGGGENAEKAEGAEEGRESGGGVTGSGLHYDEDEAAHTFRRRRLTYTKHHLEGAAAAAAEAAAAFGDISDDEDDEEAAAAPKGGGTTSVAAAAAAAAAAFGDISDDDDEEEAAEDGAADRKRKAEEEADDDDDKAQDGIANAEAGAADDDEDAAAPPAAKRRRPSPKEDKLETRVLHASAPPPHRRCRKHRLYQHPHRHDIEHGASSAASSVAGEDKGAGDGDAAGVDRKESVPAWRKRRLLRHSIDEDESLLPFPRDAVGIYSCHGVEPLYDSDYEHSQEDDDESPAESSGGNGNAAVTAKINQDRGGIAFPYGGCPRTALFAAYDGHGEGGELVSQYALHEIQRRLEIHPEFAPGKDVAEAFKTTFVDVDECLKEEEEIEPLYAGTTACVCLLRGTKLSVANAGDSRAVLARRMEGDAPLAVPQDASATDTAAEEKADDDAAPSAPKIQLAPFDLSVDQNPDSPGEKERILSSGGFVSPPPEEGLSARVWLDPTFTQIGLAMARSIGDHAVKTVGVISEPVVTHYDLTPQDEFMIVATDGVWEFIESAEAVDIVQGFLEKGLGASRACQGLIEAAAAKWHEYEGDYRDDITALVVRFDGIWDHGSKGKGEAEEKGEGTAGEKEDEAKSAEEAPESKEKSEGQSEKEERGLDL